MSHDLPQALASAVFQLLEQEGRDLRSGSAALSAHYRKGGTSAGGINLAAYLAARLPATYAAVHRVLEELAARCPGLMPETLLDAGAGPGTASWAAAQLWPTLQAVTLLDTNPAFLALAQQLAASGPPTLARARCQHASLMTPGTTPADVVIAAYALAELPENAAGDAAAALWRISGRALVVIEPGTPQGFARIAKVRTWLMANGARILAPCPGAVPCPLAGSDWCHFAVRLARRRLHLQAKQATVPFEDEKFSYVVATRGEGDPAGARVLTPPRIGKASASAHLCTPLGRIERVIARRDAAAYKQAKKWQWGGTAPDANNEP